MNVDLKLEWADWLTSLPWDYFLTITFRAPVPGHRSDSVLNAIGKHLCARHKPEMVFLGAEAHLSQAIHFHGLYKSTTPATFQPEWWWKLCGSEVWRTLFETYGRSKVELVRDQSRVSAYVSKYCVKEIGSYGVYGRADWET